MGFVYRKEFSEKTARQRTGRSPGPTEEAYVQRVFKSLILRENVSFSTIVFFETGLLDVITKMKNVFDE